MDLPMAAADALFLWAETPTRPLHVGALAVLSQPDNGTGRYLRKVFSAEVARQVGLLLDRSGLQRQEFASRIGVTAQDLTAYLDGIVSPSASLMIRMRRLSDRFVRAKSVRAADS